MIVRDQLNDVPTRIEEVERGGTAVGVHDRRAFLFVRIAVKGEQLVPLFNPCRGVMDRPARDVDREVIARIGCRRRLLEADRRRLQRDLDRTVAVLAHRQPERLPPEARLAGDIAGRERELMNPHLVVISADRRSSTSGRRRTGRAR
jgi:hypothetical protein